MKAPAFCSIALSLAALMGAFLWLQGRGEARAVALGNADLVPGADLAAVLPTTAFAVSADSLDGLKLARSGAEALPAGLFEPTAGSGSGAVLDGAVGAQDGGLLLGRSGKRAGSLAAGGKAGAEWTLGGAGAADFLVGEADPGDGTAEGYDVAFDGGSPLGGADGDAFVPAGNAANASLPAGVGLGSAPDLTFGPAVANAPDSGGWTLDFAIVLVVGLNVLRRRSTLAPWVSRIL